MYYLPKNAFLKHNNIYGRVKCALKIPGRPKIEHSTWK